MSTYKQKFNLLIGKPKDTSHSKTSLNKLTGISVKDLDEIKSRGIGAARTAGISRPQVKSEEQWANARVLAFIMKTYEGIKKDKDKINQDNDLYVKYKKKGLKLK